MKTATPGAWPQIPGSQLRKVVIPPGKLLDLRLLTLPEPWASQLPQTLHVALLRASASMLEEMSFEAVEP